MSTLSAPDLATLNREIAQLETDAARLEIERAAIARTASQRSRRLNYLRFVRWLRAPRTSFALYPLAVLVVGPLVVGVVAMVLFSMFVSTWTLPFGGFVFGLLIGLVAFAILLFSPSDEVLPASIVDLETNLRSEQTRLESVVARLAEVRSQLSLRHGTRGHLAAGDKLQRAMLLQRNWKAMQGAEWEDYVVEVCRTLGANVHRGPTSTHVPPPPPGSGARGVIRRPITPIFVTFSPRRYAVAAVSEIRPFHAAAVSQIVGELNQHGCDSLAIITNTRITEGSQQLARSRNCTLIGEDEFPDFALGKTTL